MRPGPISTNPDDATKLAVKCWHPDPLKRPTMKQVAKMIKTIKNNRLYISLTVLILCKNLQKNDPALNIFAILYIQPEYVLILTTKVLINKICG